MAETLKNRLNACLDGAYEAFYGKEALEKERERLKPKKRRKYSNKLYPAEFNRELKLLIRRRDGWKCRKCGCPQEECETSLHIHHIDEDKTNLNPFNLVSLCKGCHFGIHNSSVSVSFVQ